MTEMKPTPFMTAESWSAPPIVTDTFFPKKIKYKILYRNFIIEGLKKKRKGKHRNRSNYLDKRTYFLLKIYQRTNKQWKITGEK